MKLKYTVKSHQVKEDDKTKTLFVIFMSYGNGKTERAFPDDFTTKEAAEKFLKDRNLE